MNDWPNEVAFGILQIDPRAIASQGWRHAPGEHAVLDVMGVVLDPRFAVVCAACFVGGFMRGFVGFGGALVTIPALTLAYEPRLAVAAMTIAGLPSLVQVLPDAVRNSEHRIIVPMSLAILLTAPLGTLALVSIDPALMKIVISALVVVMVAMMFRGSEFQKEVGRPILLAAGIVSGLVQGIAGIGGPPAVAVILSRPGPPAQQRGNVLAALTAVSLASLLPLWYFGHCTKAAIVIGLVMAPLYVLSTTLGSRYFAYGGARHFRRAAIATLAVIGVVTFLASVRSYLAG